MPWKQSKKFRNFSRENCVNGSKYPMMNLPPSFELLSAIWDPEENDGEPFAEVGKRYPVWGILSGSSVSFKVAAPEPPL